MFQEAVHLGGNAPGIALFRAAPHHPGEVFGGRRAGGHGGVGILVAQLVEREGAGGRPLHRAGDGAGQRGETRGDGTAVVEVALAVGEQAVLHLLDRAAVPHGREGVEQRLAGAHVTAHVAGGHRHHAGAAAGAGEGREAHGVVPLEGSLRQAADALPEHLAPRRQAAPVPLRRRQRHAGAQPLGAGRDHPLRQPAAPAALSGSVTDGGPFRSRGRDPPMPLREEPAEVRVAAAVDRPDHDRRRVDRLEQRPDHQRHAEILRRRMGAHDPGEGRPVGDGDAGIPQRVGGADELLRMRGPLEKGEIAGAVQLRVGRDAGKGVGERP